MSEPKETPKEGIFPKELPKSEPKPEPKSNKEEISFLREEVAKLNQSLSEIKSFLIPETEAPKDPPKGAPKEDLKFWDVFPW